MTPLKFEIATPPALAAALDQWTAQIKAEIEIAIGADLDAIGGWFGVPPREAIAEWGGWPLESDATYRRRVLIAAGFSTEEVKP